MSWLTPIVYALMSDRLHEPKIPKEQTNTTILSGV